MTKRKSSKPKKQSLVSFLVAALVRNATQRQIKSTIADIDVLERGRKSGR